MVKNEAPVFSGGTRGSLSPFVADVFGDSTTQQESPLQENMPPWDVLNLGSLELGILPATVAQALQVRVEEIRDRGT